MATKPIRAGGYVIRGSGWELEHQPHPDPPSAAEPEAGTGMGTGINVATGQETAGGEPLPPTDRDEQPTDVERDGRVRDECPDCGKTVPINKDGSLRKHVCSIEAPEPQVTFDEGE